MAKKDRAYGNMKLWGSVARASEAAETYYTRIKPKLLDGSITSEEIEIYTMLESTAADSAAALKED